MKHLIKMPSIERFDNIIRDVTHIARYIGEENGKAKYDNSIELPKINFKGTIKLRGTNASICITRDGDFWTQSKGGIITPERDNGDFSSYVMKNEEFFKSKMQILLDEFDLEEVCVYGEWAGKGIQKGVGISEIEKTFFTFGIKFKVKNEEDFRWALIPETALKIFIDENLNCRSIYEFETYEIEIDFENPKLFQNKLIEITNEVEKQCPVAKAYGIDGIGEGVVWNGYYKDEKLTFKVKGEKHTNLKVKKLKPVDEENKKIEFENYTSPA